MIVFVNKKPHREKASEQAQYFQSKNLKMFHLRATAVLSGVLKPDKIQYDMNTVEVRRN